MYDRALTYSLPASLSASSGLNALAHSLEAFWAPGRNPVTSLLAEESIRALARGLPGSIDDPADADARSDALYGAYLAGASLGVAGSSLHHKVCHVLGGAYDLPHAPTHAVVLPHVLALIVPALPDVEARVARPLEPRPAARSLRSSPCRSASVLLAPCATSGCAPATSSRRPTWCWRRCAESPVPLDREGIAALLRRAWHGPPEVDA